MTSSDPDLDAALSTIRRFAEERIRDTKLERAGVLSLQLRSELAELGVFGLNLPAEYGGSAFGLRGATRAVAELARHDRSVATTVGLHLGLGTRGLVGFGTDTQRERWLPDLASGKSIASFAATEPNAGSDLAAITTTLASSNDQLTLRGEKAYVTNGGFAGIFTVLAKSPGLGGAQRGHSLVVVERTDSGVDVGAEEHKLGLRASSTTPIRFDVSLSPDRVLGAPGTGMTLAQEILAFGRTLMSAGCEGAARAALHRALEHTQTRRQFGRVLLSLDVVKDQLAEMASEVFAIEAIVSWAAHADPDRLERPDQQLERRSLSAKVYASEACGRVCDRAIQLFGGSGFIEDIGVAILARDARVTRIFEGANDVLLQKAGAVWAMEGKSWKPAGGSAVELCEALDAYRDDLVKSRGVRLLGDARALHRLGSLAIARDLIEAMDLRATNFDATARGERDRKNITSLTNYMLERLGAGVRETMSARNSGDLAASIVDALVERDS
ncbi:MAG: acyl-CoA dehydrogenase family protein [Deltaproteobacteria bacterium]|nr:acyl-CoA dehydrogenase family protein [Deltaproteobacteria bacterium]